MAYKIYRLYSGRDSAGEFLEGKDTIFWRDSAAFWEEESRWSMGNFFQHISRRIFKRVLGNFGWRLLGKE